MRYQLRGGAWGLSDNGRRRSRANGSATGDVAQRDLWRSDDRANQRDVDTNDPGRRWRGHRNRNGVEPEDQRTVRNADANPDGYGYGHGHDYANCDSFGDSHRDTDRDANDNAVSADELCGDRSRSDRR